MNRTLAQAFPHVYCELDFTNPLELTVATILSAQSTDKRVNLTTPALFKRYRTALDYAQADRAELEELVRPTGFYRNKANSLMRLGQELVERFDGKVPDTLDELVTLPGVGRKTANVILGNAFDIPGITVDTHFGRLVRRWRWTGRGGPGEGRARRRRAHRAQRVDAAEPPGDLPRPPRVPCHVNRPAACACWPRTARRSAPGRPIRWSPRRWSRGRRPSTCWRWPGSRASLRSMSTSTRWTVAVMVVVVALGVALWTQLGDSGSPTRRRSAPAAGPRPPRRRHRRSARRPARRAPTLRPAPAGTGRTGAVPGSRGLRGITLECAGDGTRSTSPRPSRAGRPSSTCGRTGVVRAPRSCPRWPSISAGSDPTSRC